MDKQQVYQPEAYWQERLSRDFSLVGVGHAGFGLEYNIWLYRARLRALRRILKNNKIDCAGKTLLDIGVGTGFYIDFWKALGVNRITGIDITDRSIEMLKERYHDHKNVFIKADITKERLPVAGKFDIVTVFDVLFHIIDDMGFEKAIDNIGMLARGGAAVFISDNFLKEYKPAQIYEKDRTFQYYKKVFSRNSMHIEDIRPIFFFLNVPIDIENVKSRAARSFIKSVWRLTKNMAKHCGKLGILGKAIMYLWGMTLYIIDGAVLSFVSSGPGAKFLYVKHISETNSEI